jgi:hypothetical protein
VMAFSGHGTWRCMAAVWTVSQVSPPVGVEATRNGDGDRGHRAIADLSPVLYRRGPDERRVKWRGELKPEVLKDEKSSTRGTKYCLCYCLQSVRAFRAVARACRVVQRDLGRRMDRQLDGPVQTTVRGGSKAPITRRSPGLPAGRKG